MRELRITPRIPRIFTDLLTAKSVQSVKSVGLLKVALLCTLAVILLLLHGSGRMMAQQYEPTIGQKGKDVIWVPTPPNLVVAMLDVSKVTAKDIVIDLGSGDGRMVIAAAKRGARSLGVEFNPDMVRLSRANAAREGVAGNASFVQGDIFEADFSKATVLTLYLLPNINMKLRPKILAMPPGTRVVSHAFDMGDWDPDQSVKVDGRTAYLWIVPARVAGVWFWPAGELTLKQGHQKIAGTLKLDGQLLPIRYPKMEGNRISFAAGDTASSIRVYSGRVNGSTIQGTVKIPSGPEVKWTATRR
jgi:SAM-dependent methyltransferase